MQTTPNNNVDISLDDLVLKQLLLTFDLLPDILFWVKDHESRIVHANKHFLEHFGISKLEHVIGLTDYEFAPPHIAKQFIEDDKHVLNGEAVTDRLEMNIVEGGEIGWFTTSKRPLFNSTNEIVGSYGTSRHLEKTAVTLNGVEALKVPLRYIRENYMKPISLEHLAEISHLSISGLERRFKKFLSKTPNHYINDVRLEHARKILVETTSPIADVAYLSGFNNPSYFTRCFKEKFSQLPSEFRTEHQKRLK